MTAGATAAGPASGVRLLHRRRSRETRRSAREGLRLPMITLAAASSLRLAQSRERRTLALMRGM